MKIAIALLAAPIGYLALSAYLFSRVRPLPITDISNHRVDEPQRERVLAA